MARPKHSDSRLAVRQAASAGIPYTHPETGERCTLAEYRKATRERNRQNIVAELHAAVADPAAYDAALGETDPGDSAA